MKDHYDVGILGVWYGCNYGSIATYYALQQTIEKLGYSTLMVHYPRLKPDDGRMKGTIRSVLRRSITISARPTMCLRSAS